MKKIIFRALLLLGGATLGSCSEELETDLFGLSGNTLQFPVDGGTQTLVVDTKCDCTLSCDADWIDYTPQYVEAGKSELTITAAENPTLETREATILLANEELNLTRTIAVRQEGVGGDRVIAYTTADNNPIAVQESAFGATLLCHDYDPETRTGALAFDRAVTEIGENAFAGCSNLMGIKIPDSVTEIGGWGFYGCSSLTSIAIPNGVTEIRESTFSECSGLTSIKIPDSVTEIGSWGFSGCSSLTSVTIGNSVTTIGWSAFTGCSSLANIKIPDSVTEIGGYAFEDCSSLTSITIPNGVTEIGNGAFSGCSSLRTFNGQYASSDKRCLIVEGVLIAFAPAELTSYTIPNHVTEIGSLAFSDCSSLTSIKIPDSITGVGDSAFAGCSSLTSITIPNGVTEIWASAFAGCSSLTSITIPYSVTE
ncbi:MAG: leucine-rich repeat protein, partial [Alistipes sp.]|nr:leucine-rich repeat protein [Alistipes sp.]